MARPSADGEERPDVARASAAETLGPLVPLVVSVLAAGRAAAVLGSRSTFGPVSLAVLVVVACAAIVSAAALRGRVGPSAGLALVLAGALVGCSGVLVRLHTHSYGLIPELVARGGTALVEAEVAVEPRRGTRGWQTVVRVRALDGIGTRERAAIVLADALPLGTPVRLVASARPLPEGGYGRWLAQQHAVALLDVRDLEVSGRPGRVSRASELVRERIRRAATRHLASDRGGLLVGFVTGDTRLLPETDVAAMQATGLSHLTAVSGSNTAVLLGGVAALLALARAPASLRWTVLLVMVPWFAFLTRLEPSVLRAGVMAVLVIGAAVRGVARDARHLLAGAVLLLVLIDPMLTWSLGLMLSAGATLGVLVVAPALAGRIERWLPSPLAQLVAITLGAQLAVTPVLLAGFGTVELVSVPANLLAVPLAALGSAVAFVASAIALVHVPLAGSVFTVAGWPAAGVLAVARRAETLGGAVVLPDAPEVRMLASIVALAILAAWALVAALRRR